MSPQASPFLKLPTEIRLPIYRLVLPYSNSYYDLESSDHPVPWHKGLCPAILFVNRQIYQEAADLLYRENIFTIYVRHPREPRLPMNEGRADPESFLLLSWSHRHWAHPKNPKMPLSILRGHRNLRDIQLMSIRLPPLDDLIGVDAYMRRSSYPSFHGIKAWVDLRSKSGGYLDKPEKDRLEYIHMSKEPCDEVGKLLQELHTLEFVSLGIPACEYTIHCLEYVLGKILERRNVGYAKCFYVTTVLKNQRMSGDQDDPLLRKFENSLQGNYEHSMKEGASCLPGKMDQMYQLLQCIRARQLLATSEHLPSDVLAE